MSISTTCPHCLGLGQAVAGRGAMSVPRRNAGGGESGQARRFVPRLPRGVRRDGPIALSAWRGCVSVGDRPRRGCGGSASARTSLQRTTHRAPHHEMGSLTQQSHRTVRRRRGVSPAAANIATASTATAAAAAAAATAAANSTASAAAAASAAGRCSSTSADTFASLAAGWGGGGSSTCEKGKSVLRRGRVGFAANGCDSSSVPRFVRLKRRKRGIVLVGFGIECLAV